MEVNLTDLRLRNDLSIKDNLQDINSNNSTKHETQEESSISQSGGDLTPRQLVSPGIDMKDKPGIVTSTMYTLLSLAIVAKNKYDNYGGNGIENE